MSVAAEIAMVWLICAIATCFTIAALGMLSLMVVAVRELWNEGNSK